MPPPADAVRLAASGRRNTGASAVVLPVRWHALLALLAVVAGACTIPQATGTDSADMPGVPAITAAVTQRRELLVDGARRVDVLIDVLVDVQAAGTGPALVRCPRLARFVRL